VGERWREEGRDGGREIEGEIVRDRGAESGREGGNSGREGESLSSGESEIAGEEVGQTESRREPERDR
jgi:hypothetical protein